MYVFHCFCAEVFPLSPRKNAGGVSALTIVTVVAESRATLQLVTTSRAEDFLGVFLPGFKIF